MYQDIYKIADTRNLDAHGCFHDSTTYPAFQKDLKKFKSHITELVDNRRHATFLKFGDGDHKFLTKTPEGSAHPGTRALSKSYDDIDHSKFVSGAQKCDFYTCEIYPENRRMFRDVISRDIDYPAEYVYGLVANRWLFTKFKGRIGLIGASEKLNIIESLLQHKEYQEYLGLESFTDYIHFPQKFAADDIELVEDFIGKQLENATADIFLLGIGHSKTALLHTFTKYKKAVYLDVGAGIDMIAGCINVRRPFAGDWINYRLSDYDYSQVDYLRYGGEGRHIFL